MRSEIQHGNRIIKGMPRRTMILRGGKSKGSSAPVPAAKQDRGKMNLSPGKGAAERVEIMKARNRATNPRNDSA
jgi:hypothetical protein